MKHYPVKFEVREDANGWRLFALPCHGLGWDPIAMTQPRGTPASALTEFAMGIFRLTQPPRDYLPHELCATCGVVKPCLAHPDTTGGSR